MNKRQFVKKRQIVWREFERLVNQFDRGIAFHKPKAKEIAKFSKLFRELANDLATVRAHEWDKQLEDYLNDLAARGHNAFYRSPMGRWKLVVKYLTTDFPQLFRRNINFFLFASLLFFGSMFLTWGIVQQNPSLATRIISQAQLDQMEASYRININEEGEKDNYSGWDNDSISRYGQQRSSMAGHYISNNAGIGLQTFALGVFMGVPTILALVFNGVHIGAVAGYLVGLGHSEKFLSFVVTHGSFELTAIAISGGAGLMMADAIIRPKDRTRFDSLLVRGREAVQIACGAAVMFIIAAFIEAFWSPAPIPASYKHTVGLSLWVVVCLYLTFVGRNR